MSTGDQNVTDIARPTRGLKNKNPGNIRFNPKTDWKGQEGQDNRGFVIFDTDINGIRADVINIHTHWSRDGQNTIRKLIQSYAPPTENNTANYIDFVVTKVGKPADETIEAFTKLLALSMMKAIIAIEQGVQPYDDTTLYAGIDSAFIHFAGDQA